MKGIQTPPFWCLRCRMGTKQVISLQGDSKCGWRFKGEKVNPLPQEIWAAFVKEAAWGLNESRILTGGK